MALLFLQKNYRGVHLTCVIAKTVERIIGKPLVQHLQLHAFGENQWAFTKKRSARDLATLCVCTWLFAICTGYKIGAFLSDITGAFDRVFKNYLMAKLYRAGIGDVYLNFLNAYFEPRIGRVTIAGVFSDAFQISDSVFQGTVLGPTLWNVFFADVMHSARAHGGKEALFADDLSVFQKFARSCSNVEVKHALCHTQQEVHKWGERFRVTFDASKEHAIIIHPIDGE